MVMTALDRTAPDSPRLPMTRETPTQHSNDSCATSGLDDAIARGVTGATSDPSVVLEVLYRVRRVPAPTARGRGRGPGASEVGG